MVRAKRVRRRLNRDRRRFYDAAAAVEEAARAREESASDEVGDAKPGSDQFNGQDPFPDIPPALLNSADVDLYATTLPGMLEPYEPNRLKPASYEVRVGDLFAVSDNPGDDDAKWSYEVIGEHGFDLPPNSLVYVAIDTRVRLPDYIAVRFNLTIKHVYRGLLAGTGPIIDPGFTGRVYIPLHNLSSVRYHFKQHEPLLYLEFTKVSPHYDWCNYEWGAGQRPPQPDFVPFPGSKSDRDLPDYLYHASPNEVISSSFDPVNRRTNEVLKQLALIRRVGFIAGVALTISIISVLATLFNRIGSLDQR
ncbi:MAG: hypothetical protein HKN91_09070, partial [Acidimicrobiia bacterium]|nr:hypothetical protein [Acidimicrobiia bacterium]